MLKEEEEEVLVLVKGVGAWTSGRKLVYGSWVTVEKVRTC